MNPGVSDFRSDTVTQPSPTMRRAMAEAEVGDDVFADDPTVAALEAESAALFGKEAGLFTPSGTMANLIAITCQTRPGDEIFVETYAHTYNNEVGSAARFAGVVTRTLDSDRGRLDPEQVRRFARAGDLHQPRTALLCVENTHNFHSGAVVPIELLRELRTITAEREIALHLDGARLWNAVAATGIDPKAYGEVADTIMFCFSKGLGAPIGSMLLGDRALLEEGRRVRKALGGGMRQVGVIAAAASVALHENRARLAEDHTNARALAEGIAGITGAIIDPGEVDTNILFMRTAAGVPSYAPIVEGLREAGVLAIPLGELGIRFVTHLDVGPADVERALGALGRLVPRAN